MKYKLVEIVIRYEGGREYALRGKELDIFMEYLREGLLLQAVHDKDMTEWNKLCEKILSTVERQ